LSNGTESLLDFAIIGIDRVNAIRIEDGGEAIYGAPYAGADVDAVTGHFYEEVAVLHTVIEDPVDPDPIDPDPINPVVICPIDFCPEDPELIEEAEALFCDVADIEELIMILQNELLQALCRRFRHFKMSFFYFIFEIKTSS